MAMAACIWANPTKSRFYALLLPEPMHFDNSFQIKADTKRVFELFRDPVQVAAFLPGAQVVQRQLSWPVRVN